MSDMLRGMPLSQSSQSIYQSPGSQVAQLAGIGLGVSGLMGKGSAAGGSVSSYADGGTVGGYNGMDEQLAYNNEPVIRMAEGGETAPAGTQTAFGFIPAMAGGGITDAQHVESLISKLSDQQLKESLQIAINTGDKQREQTVRDEMAIRASEHKGMAAAYNQQPQGMMAEEPMYARGGIVAFAGPTEDNNYSTTSSVPADVDALGSQLDAARAEVDKLNKTRPGLKGGNLPEWQAKSEEANARRSSLQSQYEQMMSSKGLDKAAFGVTRGSLSTVQPKADPLVKAMSEPQALREAKRSDKGISDYFSTQMENIPTERKTEAKTEAPKLTRADNKLIGTISKAVSTQTDMPMESIESGYKKAVEMMKSSGDDAGLKEIRDKIAGLSKVPEFDRNAAIAKFGFQMAAAAAQPGTPRGFAGIIQSAAKAAPSISEALEAHNKDVKDAQRIGAQLTIEQAKYEAALRRGDQQTALGLAQNMRMMQMQQAQLTESSRHNRATEGLQAASIGQKNAILQIADRIKASDPKLSDFEAMQKASQIAGYGYRTDAASQNKRAEAIAKIENSPTSQMMLLMKDKTSDQYRTLLDERNRKIREINSLYGGGGGAPAASEQPTINFLDIGKS